MTPSELKFNVEKNGKREVFFNKRTLKFFGDTMRNYGCRSNFIDDLPVWELYRKRPVKHGLIKSSYFRKDNFKKVSAN